MANPSYGLSDMEPSHTRAPALPRRAAADASGSATKKKRTRQRAQKLPLPEKNEEFAPGRTNYNLDETEVLTRCWIDISEDPVFANNQRQIAYWERIADKYNEVKPQAAYKRHREQLRKYWNQVKKQVNLFSAEYEKCSREQGSGESMADVCDKAIATYTSLYGDFKHYNSWLLLKDRQTFQGGILPLSAAGKRAKNTASGVYRSSNSGAHPMDLNQPMFEDESSGTPMSSRRPIGVKAAKNKGKAKATSSQAVASAPTLTPTSAAGHAYAELVAAANRRTLLDTHNALRQTDDPTQVEYLKEMIEHLRRKLGMI